MVREGVRARAVFFVASILSAWLFHRLHIDYLAVEHEFWGLPYYDLSWLGWAIVVAALFAVSMCFPMRLRVASDVVIVFLFAFVFIPSLVVSLSVSADALSLYGPVVFSLTVGFCAACLLAGSRAPVATGNSGVLPNARAMFWIAFAWLFVFAYVYISFRDVLGFATLDLIYEQREAGRARNWIEAYSQTYLGYVLSPGLLAYGLCARRASYTTLGFLGFFLMYLVTAERSLFVMPIAMVGLFFFFGAYSSHPRFTSLLLLSIFFIAYLSAQFAESSLTAALVAFYFSFRVMAVPGSMLWQYQSVFSEFGYTYWSNVKGLHWVLDKPAAYASFESWPQLGYFVAEEILGLESNSNANLFAYDGVAAAGAVGVFLVCLLFGAWLRILNQASKFCDRRFVWLIVFPMAFLLTNGSLFSLILSFGGAFWPIVLWFSTKPKKLSFRHR
jgi:hypothetical protein